MVFITDVVRVRIYLALASLSDLGCTPEQAASSLADACTIDEDSGVMQGPASKLVATITEARSNGKTLADAAVAAFGRVLAEERAVLSKEIGSASCRERVCQYGVDLGGRCIIKKK